VIAIATQKDLEELSVMGEWFINDSISSKFIGFNAQRFYEYLLKLIEADALLVWVAKTDTEIMGAVGLLVTPNVYDHSEILADIYFIDVVPKFRKQGLAKKFMQIAEAYCAENNIKAITISFNSRDIANRVSKSAGYTFLEYKLIKEV